MPGDGRHSDAAESDDGKRGGNDQRCQEAIFLVTHDRFSFVFSLSGQRREYPQLVPPTYKALVVPGNNKNFKTISWLENPATGAGGSSPSGDSDRDRGTISRVA